MKTAFGPARCRPLSPPFGGVVAEDKGVETKRPARRILAGAALVALALTCTPAAAEVALTSCGAPIKSIAKTGYNNAFSTTSTSYVDLPKAMVKVSVPSGQTQCVKVRFSTTLSCAVLSSADHCFVKLLDSLSPFAWAPSAAVYASETKGAAHSFEWVTRLSAGSHVLQIQTSIGGGTLVMSSWVLDVEIAK